MLETVLVIVCGLLVLTLGLALWLLGQRGQLLAGQAQAHAALQASEATLARAQADRAEALRRVESLDDEQRALQRELNEAAVAISALKTRLEESLSAQQANLAHLQQRQHQELESLREQHALELKAALDIANEKLGAAEAIRAQTLATLAQADTQLRSVFQSLAGEALKSATGQLLQQATSTLAHQQAQFKATAGSELDLKQQAFTQLARQMDERLRITGEKLEQLDRRFGEQAASITTQLSAVGEASGQLRDQTGKLVKALREPQVRGRYGELQLRRVAELAGMRAYCDFAEQSTTVDDQGEAKRPDMVVRLPNGRELIVDAKANLKPYIDAMEASDPAEIERHLQAFAEAVEQQAKKLGAKAYYKDYSGSPDFVVMFVPGDQFMDAALSRRPELLDAIGRHNVVLASPSTLIAMLRAVAVGFQEQRLSETAREMGQLVRKLRDQMGITLGHVHKVGENLQRAVASYNEFVGSYERRLKPQIDRLADSAPTDERALPEIKPIETTVRVSGLFGPGSGLDEDRVSAGALPLSAGKDRS